MQDISLQNYLQDNEEISLEIYKLVSQLNKFSNMITEFYLAVEPLLKRTNHLVVRLPKNNFIPSVTWLAKKENEDDKNKNV